MFTKLIKVFESDIEGLDSHEAKVKCRPDQEGYLTCRKIIQFWSQAIEPCACKDLNKEDYDTFKRMVLTSQELNKDIVSLIERVPKYFHMGLMPSVLHMSINSNAPQPLTSESPHTWPMLARAHGTPRRRAHR